MEIFSDCLVCSYYYTFPGKKQELVLYISSLLLYRVFQHSYDSFKDQVLSKACENFHQRLQVERCRWRRCVQEITSLIKKDTFKKRWKIFSLSLPRPLKTDLVKVKKRSENRKTIPTSQVVGCGVLKDCSAAPIISTGWRFLQNWNNFAILTWSCTYIVHDLRNSLGEKLILCDATCWAWIGAWSRWRNRPSTWVWPRGHARVLPLHQSREAGTTKCKQKFDIFPRFLFFLTSAGFLVKCSFPHEIGDMLYAGQALNLWRRATVTTNFERSCAVATIHWQLPFPGRCGYHSMADCYNCLYTRGLWSFEVLWSLVQVSSRRFDLAFDLIFG